MTTELIRIVTTRKRRILGLCHCKGMARQSVTRDAYSLSHVSKILCEWS